MGVCCTWREKTLDNQYAGGNWLDDLGWFDENSGDSIKKVGLKKPNELGIYDMSGNASEWCRDWYEDYYGLEKYLNEYSVLENNKFQGKNPKGPSTGFYRVLRGGSYKDTQEKCELQVRDYMPAYVGLNELGFRVVLSKK